MAKPRLNIDIGKVEELAAVCDNNDDIARSLGISPETLYSRKRESTVFAEAIKRGRARANAYVGGRLMKLIQDGNVAATIFFLKTRCGWRETSNIGAVPQTFTMKFED